MHFDAVVHLTSLRRWSSEPAAPPRAPSMQAFSLCISFPVRKSFHIQVWTTRHRSVPATKPLHPPGAAQHAANQVPSCIANSAVAHKKLTL